MKCPRCNNEIEDGSIVCTSCGNVLTEVEKNVYNLSFIVKKEEEKPKEELFKSIKNKLISKLEEKQKEEAILNGEIEDDIDIDDDDDDIDLDDDDDDIDLDDEE